MNRIIALAVLGLASTVVWAEDTTNAGSGIVTPDAAVFTEFTDFALFQGAFGAPLSRIGFNEVADGAVVTNQYQADGVNFTDADDTTLADAAFEEDGVGLSGNGRIHVQFSQPALAVGAFFPGAMTIELFDVQGGISQYTSTDFGGGGGGHFGGIIGDTGFGFVEIRDWVDDLVFIDDLVFGFAPPEGAITGCISITGIAPTLNIVVLAQPDEPRQFAQTDVNGCYVFDNPVPGKWFTLVILGDRIPSQE